MLEALETALSPKRSQDHHGCEQVALNGGALLKLMQGLLLQAAPPATTFGRPALTQLHGKWHSSCSGVNYTAAQRGIACSSNHLAPGVLLAAPKRYLQIKSTALQGPAAAVEPGAAAAGSAGSSSAAGAMGNGWKPTTVQGSS